MHNINFVQNIVASRQITIENELAVAMEEFSHYVHKCVRRCQ